MNGSTVTAVFLNDVPIDLSRFNDVLKSAIVEGTYRLALVYNTGRVSSIFLRATLYS